MKKYELINFCEFDKYATQSYCAIHNVDESLNLGDITKIDENNLKEFNMICGGSPCQDFSVAGKRKGAVWECKECGHKYNPLTVHWSERDTCPNCHSKDLDKSRSSLLVEWLRIIRANKPNFGIYENVKNIVGKEFKETTFKIFENELNEYGYNTYWQVLNAKDYGIPQNRERVYLILIKKELDNNQFCFPKSIKLNKKLQDILCDDVDNKWYLTEEQLKSIRESSYIQNSRRIQEKEYCDTLCARDWKDPKCVKIKTVCEQRTDEGLRFFKDNVCGSLRTIDSCGDKRVIEDGNYIRKLVPLEAFRLMGFGNDDFYKAQNIGMSNTQLYKQAGNSIVVDVLYYILLELYKVMPYLFEDLKLSSFFSGIGAFEKALDRLFNYINLKSID